MTHQVVPCLVPTPEGLRHHRFHLNLLFTSQVLVLAQVVVVQEGCLQLLVDLVARPVVLSDHLGLGVDLVPGLTPYRVLLLLAVSPESNSAEDFIGRGSEFALRQSVMGVPPAHAT